MVLANKREVYDISNQDTVLILKGMFTWTKDKRIIEFSGTFTTMEDVYGGNFSYTEMEDGTASKYINSIPVDLQDEGSTLIDSTITEIKSQLNP